MVAVLYACVFYYTRFYFSKGVRFSYFNVRLLFFFATIEILVVSEEGWSILLFWDLLGVRSFFLILFYLNQKRVYGALCTVLRGRIGDLFLLCLFSYSIGLRILFLFPLVIGFILLRGITKRAQFPFMGWLPLAIAAPTPVSSLVHSSTLVTAGLVLLWTHSWVLSSSSLSQLGRMLGMVSLFFSGVVALFEQDMKKVVALSTLSQVSFCIVAVFLGILEARYYHCISHAFVKCFLFMEMGYLIYILIGQQDGRFLSYGNQSGTVFSLLVGVACLSGLVFLFSGVRKEAVLFVFASTAHTSILFFFILIRLSLTLFYGLRLSWGTFSFFGSRRRSLYSYFIRSSFFCASVGAVLLSVMHTRLVYLSPLYLELERYIPLHIVLFVFFSLGLYMKLRYLLSKTLTLGFLLKMFALFSPLKGFECLVNKIAMDLFIALLFFRNALSTIMISNISLLFLSVIGTLLLVL